MGKQKGVQINHRLLAYLRGKTFLKQAAFANAIQKSKSYIEKLETGVGRPSQEMVLTLAGALAVDANVLCDLDLSEDAFESVGEVTRANRRPVRGFKQIQLFTNVMGQLSERL